MTQRDDKPPLAGSPAGDGEAGRGHRTHPQQAEGPAGDDTARLTREPACTGYG